MLQMASDFTIQDVSVHQSYPEPTKPPLGQFTSGNTEIIVLEASNWEEYHEMYWCVGYECQNGCIITVRVNVYDDNKVLKLSYQLTINLNCEGEDAASLEISVEYDALINGVMRIIKRSFVICSEAGSSHFFNNDYEMGYINVYYNNLRDIPTDRGEGWDTSVFTPAHYDFYPQNFQLKISQLCISKDIELVLQFHSCWKLLKLLELTTIQSSEQLCTTIFIINGLSVLRLKITIILCLQK